jgi:hypothetical protein
MLFQAIAQVGASWLTERRSGDEVARDANPYAHRVRDAVPERGKS